MSLQKFVQRFRLVISAAMFVVLLPTLVLAFQNEPDGFRGIKWGTNITELPDMNRPVDNGDTKTYGKDYDKMSIGYATIGYLRYGFYKGRFYNVLIEYSDRANHSQILKTFYELYGSPDKKIHYGNPGEIKQHDDYIWLGSKVDIELDYYEFTSSYGFFDDDAGNFDDDAGKLIQSGKIKYNFKPITEEIKIKAIKGAGDL